ncbi:alpha/beta fold hydrolase [Actinorugispora endophytica]|uniref:Pimeloyl-ACP methyl ester carboxylesterase n=1 Tax=Actinorugispora endophytica TaxID=1605990 RepID=A0A4R6UVK9_9ACTN|nr:alpha/beta hydrolase [Actinorugispora endophytica]TDQ51428.1 pimeloyl-ACP methyl ester carboxylesterase [Actinorugispora endophytica]
MSASTNPNRAARVAAGVVAGGLSLIAAGVTGAVVAEKRVVSRILDRADPEAGERFGRLRGEPRTVVADDGVPLHAEVDGHGGTGTTFVYCHGYALSQDCWHYQRRDLTGGGRRVFWDQRAHGRSRRGRPEHSTIDQLGRDLYRVIEATVPDGDDIVLVGHSMGGMTILALAERHPELFTDRVAGVALIASTGRLSQVTLGLPSVLGRAIGASTAPFMRTLAWRPGLVDHGRRVARELSFLSSRLFGFGTGEVSAAVVDHLDTMLRQTPVDVITEFWPTIAEHDRLEALNALANVPTLVVCGDRDRITPIDHSEAISEALPEADFVRVPGAGHLVMMECPDAVNDALRTLFGRASAPAVEDAV